jgi:tRNA dimethylallyltransferase
MQYKPTKNINLIVITGPTASGKTSVAVHLAHHIKSEIISADSRQVYKGMDIGTGKDLKEYEIGSNKIPYHLIDTQEAGKHYNVFEYQNDFFKIFETLTKKSIIPVLCGGTGMYIDAVLRNYKLIHVPVNPILRTELSNHSLAELESRLKAYKSPHNQSDTDTKKRAIRAIEIQEFYKTHPTISHSTPKIQACIFGIDINRELRRKRISERLETRLKEGMIEEAQQLIKMGLSHDDLIYYGLEYKFLAMFLNHTLSYNEMKTQLEIAIHQFAKRQMTWFRKMEKDGHHIHWIDFNLNMEEKINSICQTLQFKL